MKEFLLKAKKIFAPGTFLTILLTILSIILLGVVFLYGYDQTPLGYIAYVLSAYTLTSLCLSIPKWVNGIKKIIYGNRHTHRIVTDHIYRAHLSVILMFIFNTLYAVFKLLSGKILNSSWQGFEGLYYFILGAVDLFILVYMMKYKDNVIKCYQVYRLCGYMMIALDVIFLILVYFVINYNKGVAYPGLMIYAAAAYTFICFTVAIVNLIKYRKYHIPVISASKIIKIITATVSLFMLQTAMFSEFGGEKDFIFTMNSLTGSAVGILILVISVYMILHAKINIKKVKVNQIEKQ